MATIKKEIRDKIVAQALREIQFARTSKQRKIGNWQKNEQMYYGQKETTGDSRANIELGRMAEFVHTLLSKIDTPMTFKFTKRKNSQLKRVQRLNALRIIDQSDGDWDITDLAGKKQAIIYGRAIFSYFADSQNGYSSHLSGVDVYDFLIDPDAGGIDIEKANYLGDYGVKFNRKELEEGIKAKMYLKEETNALLEGSGNATESSQEQTNKQARTYAASTNAQKQIDNPDIFKFWRWGTTYEGKRYYLLLSETGATAIRVEPIENVFESGLWWYWTWAAFIDLTEFWTPSYCDYVREIFMAQAVSINQSVDNTEQITKPTRVVNVAAIKDLSSLKYKRGGNTVKVSKDFDVNKAYQTIAVAPINTPLLLFEKLEAIQEKASGVTAGAKGVEQNGSGAKATIYKGNEANTADRFGLLNKSYAFGYKRFAKLWDAGVREHLVKKVAVDILGPEGIEMEEVSRRDIYRKGEKFNLIVEAADAELSLSESEKSSKVAFLASNMINPVQNPKKAYETIAAIEGFKPEEIRELMDTSEFGNAELMSEAERDIEKLLDGEKIEPNQAANTAYKQRFVDYMADHKEDLTNEQFRILADYVLLLDLPGVDAQGVPNSIIIRNTVRAANVMANKAIEAAPPVVPGAPTGGAPARPTPVVAPAAPAAPGVIGA